MAISNSRKVSYLINEIDTNLSREKKRIETNRNREVVKWEKFEKVLSGLETKLEELGLSIDEISGEKSGLTEDWEREDMLRVKLKLKVDETKFTLIKKPHPLAVPDFHTRKKMDKKAKELSEEINSMPYEMHVTVSAMSMVENNITGGKVEMYILIQ